MGKEAAAKGRGEAKLKVSSDELGSADSLRYSILTLVAAEDYEKATKSLKDAIESKPEFPQFRARAERYLKYSIDLVNGIKAKRSFPGVQNLAMSKQQDLFERSQEHYEDLKITLKKIEQIEREVKLEDLRSTVWVVKALIYSICAIVALGFARELSRGVFPSANVVLTDMANKTADWIFETIGW